MTEWTDQQLIDILEHNLSECADVIQALAIRHHKIKTGVIEYWDSKLKIVLHDLNVIKSDQ